MTDKNALRAWMWADSELNKYASIIMQLQEALETYADGCGPGKCEMDHCVRHGSCGRVAYDALQKMMEDIEKPNTWEQHNGPAPEGPK